MNDYGVKPMFETEDSAAADSPLAIFSKICSPLSKPMPKVRGAEGYQLNELLTADHIHFTDEKGIWSAVSSTIFINAKSADPFTVIVFFL